MRWYAALRHLSGCGDIPSCAKILRTRIHHREDMPLDMVSERKRSGLNGVSARRSISSPIVLRSESLSAAIVNLLTATGECSGVQPSRDPAIQADTTRVVETVPPAVISQFA